MNKPGNFDLPVFFQAEFTGGNASTFYPFHQTIGAVEVKNKMGFSFLINPTLVPYFGFYAVPDAGSKPSAKYSFYKKAATAFHEALPKHDALILKLHPDINYVLPFHWLGYRIIPRFTFRLELQSSGNLLKMYKESLRREIKKASGNLTVTESNTPEILIDLNQKDHRVRNNTVEFSKGSIINYCNNLIKAKKGKLLIAKAGNRPVAAILYVWDSFQAYYMAGAIDPDHRTSGASSLLLHEAILRSSKTVKVFDLEGSMEPGIARYFSSFGGNCVPYYQIERFPNPLAKAGYEVKKRVK